MTRPRWKGIAYLRWNFISIEQIPPILQKVHHMHMAISDCDFVHWVWSKRIFCEQTAVENQQHEAEGKKNSAIAHVIDSHWIAVLLKRQDTYRKQRERLPQD